MGVFYYTWRVLKNNFPLYLIYEDEKLFIIPEHTSGKKIMTLHHWGPSNNMD